MKKLPALLFFALIYFASIGQNSAPYIPGQALVQMKDGHHPSELIKDISHIYGISSGLRVEDDLSLLMNIWKLSFNPEVDDEYMLERLRSHQAVELAQFNHYVQQRETPNDPQFGSQWHHVNGNDKDIDSDLAWDITTGGTTATGDQIVVCVVEGGNLMHTDLVDNRWVNTNEIPNNGVDDDGNGFVDDYDGWNVQSESDNNVFEGGHGTQVMGMIGAKGNNDLGVSGINWNVKIMSVAGENLGDEASVVEAYNYPLVLRNQYEVSGGTLGAFVVATNASWGIDGGSPEEAPLWCAVYDALGEVGILSCGATANNNVNIDVVGDLPTGCGSDYMISVTATDNNDMRTFSAYGLTTIDLGAPGDNVWTTSGSSNYGATSGTSFASPLTAGAIALLYSVPCPSLMGVVHSDPQTGADLIRQALFEGVDQTPQLLTETVTGGRLNVFNSLNILINNCSANECLNPFSVSLNSENGVDFTATWTALETVLSVDLQYRAVGNPDWISVPGITDGMYNFDVLLWCTEYEVQLFSICEGESGEWSNSYNFVTDGCCVAPDASFTAIESISANSVFVSWESILAAESYNVGISVSGANDFTTTENVGGTSFEFAGLEACTDYDIRIESNCAGEEGSGYSTFFSFNTPGCGNCADADYCETIAEDATEEWISRVRLNLIDNSTESDNGYGDYTNISTILETNNTYIVTLNPGFGGFQFNEFWIVWVDYNQNGGFEANEIVYQSFSASPDENSGTFTVPDNTPIGSTRMRVSMKYFGFGGVAPGPCETMEYGEIEDYCITIEEGVGIAESANKAIQVYPNPSNGIFNFVLTVDANNAQLILMDMSGRQVMSSNLQNRTIDLSALSNGLYVYKIIDSNSNSYQGLLEKKN